VPSKRIARGALALFLLAPVASAKWKFFRAGNASEGTDTHFVKRDRMGRLVVFLARILQDGWAKHVRAIAVEESAAALLEPDGQSRVVGSGPAYFLEARNSAEVCRRKTPLSFNEIRVHSLPSGGSFNRKDWKEASGDDYQLSAVKGEFRLNGANHRIY